MQERLILEHWRDERCIERFEFSDEIVTEGTNIVIPIGCYVEIVGEDELRIKRTKQ